MTGIANLDELLKSMKPILLDDEYVFCTVQGSMVEYLHINPKATFVETEGLTLVLPKDQAEQAGLTYEGVFKQITLTVHSSLEAVGLTAAVATALANQDISTNVIAAYYHDHIFVPEDKAMKALGALQALS